MVTQQEINTVNKALNNLENVAGIHGEWAFLAHTENTGIDGILTISFGEDQIKFKTDVKNEIRNIHSTQIRARAYVNDTFLLLAQNIFLKLRKC